MKSRQDRSLTAAKAAQEQEDSKLGMWICCREPTRKRARMTHGQRHRITQPL